MSTIINILVLLLPVLHQCNSAKILAYINTPSYSHQIVYRALWVELAKRGHEVTLLTTDPMNHENITEIDLQGAYQFVEKYKIFEAASSGKGIIEIIQIIKHMLHEVMDYELSHPGVQRIKDKKFDLVIAEFVFYSTGFALAKKHNTPFIGVISIDGHYNAHDAIGNPSHPILYPDFDMSYDSHNMTFKQRCYSTIYAVLYRLVLKYYFYPDQTELIRKYIDPNLPDLDELEKDMSMLFINANPIFHNVRPMVPASVTIGGGVHIKEDSKPLPKDIQEYLDTAPHGVIYFSLGTNVRASTMSNDSKTALYEAFTELPYRVLMKFEEDPFGTAYSNLKIVKWCPQQAVLRHKNVKAFITQGGQQSMEEAIYYNIPAIGMPFFGDQFSNVNKMVTIGYGQFVDHNNIDKESLKKVIVDAIENPIYKIKGKEIRKQSMDQPMTGLEKAVWWTEYVLRHNGAHHLRSPAPKLPLYQYFLLDVIGFFLAILLVSLFVLIKSFRIIIFVLKYFLKDNKTEAAKMKGKKRE